MKISFAKWKNILFLWMNIKIHYPNHVIIFFSDNLKN